MPAKTQAPKSQNTSGAVSPTETAYTNAANIAKVSRYYRPELDVLRFFAFALVFTHHQLPVSFAPSFRFGSTLEEAGSSGVCLFFTLSAFLITELLLREREATGTIHLKAFYVRRILRIWPLYFAAIAAAIVATHFISVYRSPPRLIIPYLLLCGNWAIIAAGAFPKNSILGVLWSISIEEQFYLIWPTVMKRWGKRAIVAIACLLLPVAWLTDYLLPLHHASLEPDLWLNSFSQFQFFAIGGLLAVFMHRRSIQMHAAARTLCIAGSFTVMLFAAYPFHYLNPVKPAFDGHALCGYLSVDAMCILALVGFLGARIPTFLKPLLYLGKISYGLYVFHFPLRILIGKLVDHKVHQSVAVRVTTTYIVTAILTLAVASLSYQYFEKPFLRLKKHFTFVPSRVE
jgi:peptidoglycan/LPS O-acetylase OafA/YrhL